MVNGGGGAPGNTTPAHRPRRWYAQCRCLRDMHGCGTGAGGRGGMNRRPRGCGSCGLTAFRHSAGTYAGGAVTTCGQGGRKHWPRRAGSCGRPAVRHSRGTGTVTGHGGRPRTVFRTGRRGRQSCRWKAGGRTCGAPGAGGTQGGDQDRPRGCGSFALAATRWKAGGRTCGPPVTTCGQGGWKMPPCLRDSTSARRTPRWTGTAPGSDAAGVNIRPRRPAGSRAAARRGACGDGASSGDGGADTRLRRPAGKRRSHVLPGRACCTGGGAAPPAASWNATRIVATSLVAVTPVIANVAVSDPLPELP